MTTTSLVAELRENTKRQAKRLGKRLDLSLEAARSILARSYYRCESWNDLQGRLKAKHPDEHVRHLASLPGSPEARLYYSTNIEDLARSLSKQMLANSNLMGLYDTLNHVFGVTQEPVALSDIAVSISASPWQPANIGPDPNAVLQAFTVINGVPIMLLATRVYMPKYFQFGPDVSGDDSFFAEPYSGTFQIIWSNPGDWYDAARAYLLATEDDDIDDDDYPELTLPTIELDEAMVEHEQWFSRLAEQWYQEFGYGDHGEDFLPILISGRGTYLVFGVPARPPSNTEILPRTAIPMVGEDTDNDRTLVLVDEQPVCLEWISASTAARKHEGPYPEYFESLLNGVFSHSECDVGLFGHNGWDQGFFFIRPANQSDIDQFLRVEIEPEPNLEAFALKTDHPALAAIVLDKVASRDVMAYPSKYQSANYVAVIDIAEADELNGVSISLSVRGDNGLWAGTNLVPSYYTERRGTQKTVYANISPSFFALTDMVKKRSLRDALLCGIVLHQPAGFHDRLHEPPRRCSNLKPAPQELIDLMERPLSDAFEETPFNLLQHARRTRYGRDNY